MRSVLKKVNANCLHGPPGMSCGMRGSFHWFGLVDWHMSYFLMYCLTPSVVPSQYMHSHAQRKSSSLLNGQHVGFSETFPNGMWGSQGYVS